MSSGASMSSIFSRFGAQTSGGSNPVTPPTAPSASSTSPAANQEIAELRKELASRDARISTLLDEKDEFKAEISRLSHHLATLLNNASSPAPGQSNTNQTLSSDPLAAAGPAGSVSLASLDKLKEENEDLKNKLQVAKDKVLFHNVDKLEQDNRRLKSENTSLRQELDELRVIRSKHQEVVDAEKARYEDLMKAFANAVEIKKALEKNLLEANSKILDLERVVEDKSREQEKLELEIEKSRSSLNSVNLQLNERMAEKLREVEADHAMKVQEMKDMLVGRTSNLASSSMKHG
eukprot:TRINITY_DN2103_c0_g2_i2.p1 TRINITY_DN2103_c0_g2~~TRINITY_DN2103_c0_g2_i2.p1  ORF type:complete len:292 (+),score=74.46 TRINITY_DN2103_c0_g2_i2:37-912(+)